MLAGCHLRSGVLEPQGLAWLLQDVHRQDEAGPGALAAGSRRGLWRGKEGHAGTSSTTAA